MTNLPSTITTLSQGALANQSGLVLEKHLEGLLQGFYGFQIISYDKYKKMISSSSTLPPRLAVRHFPYRTIYGKVGKTELWMRSTKNNPYMQFPAGTTIKPFYARFECKRQTTAGSVDEKFPYLVKNAEQALNKNQWNLIGEWASHACGSKFTPGYNYQEDWENTFGYPEDNIFILGQLNGASLYAKEWLLDTIKNREEWDSARLPNKRVVYEDLTTIASVCETMFS